jgi:hypothetical protein
MDDGFDLNASARKINTFFNQATADSGCPLPNYYCCIYLRFYAFSNSVAEIGSRRPT